jgi:hypothetical protein
MAEDPSDDDRIGCFGIGCAIVVVVGFVAAYLYAMSWVNRLLRQWF